MMRLSETIHDTLLSKIDALGKLTDEQWNNPEKIKLTTFGKLLKDLDGDDSGN